ncbi:hypothetical protein [Winogradskyella thalassocola]|uniref:Uncharacterized protein n=1 Tax=Winogradskyella thalassocola TaxID=262004 RepID=A0A1G8LYI2_9FLAO|nr:hypothetical protein [Winogradskyella thalassocola]SDI60567.1 hypothetical protein SAMN04489796_11422 [Winogradskyella thalassocola]
MTKNWYLNSNDDLTKIARNYGLNNWNELTEFIQGLPYGRNKNRTDFKLVLIEKKGTCSSKHSTLKEIANRNNFPDVKLILGMYKMNNSNTPKIGNELSKYAIEYLPEAHCYLKINNVRIDLTTKRSNFKKIESDIIEELEIQPNQVAEFKIDYHKNFIRNWLTKTDLNFTFDQIWHIREQCIRNLAE